MKRVKILLVDDEEIILVGWQEALEPSGYMVRTSLSGKKAVEMAREEKPDIVVTDLVMPGMSGVEVCKKIKEMYPDTEVVFVSGHPHETEKQMMDFLKAGGRDEFLRKPLFKDEIIKVIEKITREKK
jgi:CheY-like chemotaxis protein